MSEPNSDSDFSASLPTLTRGKWQDTGLVVHDGDRIFVRTIGNEVQIATVWKDKDDE